MPLVPIKMTIPPGGFYFVDQSTNSQVGITGTDYEDLVARVEKHREANNVATSSARRDVFDHICTRFPEYCRDTDRLPPERATEVAQWQIDEGGIASRVAAWMSDFYRRFSAAPKAPEGVALRRAEVCLSCPQNVEHREGCGSCVDAVARLSYVWRGNLGTPHDQRLLGCKATAMHLPCAVWGTQFPELSPAAQSRLPSNCWRRTVGA